MRIAIVGCGYVSDFYRRTLPLHPALSLTGVHDVLPERARRFAEAESCTAYDSLSQVLADKRVDLIVNLTDPSSHFAVSSAALEAGKHVYSEKPLAPDLAEARALLELAERRGLLLSGAPCNILGEAAQTAWKVIRSGALGRIRLAYVEMDDDAVPLRDYETWTNDLGAPWPFENEFSTGCVFEHAAYYLTWLIAFFGPAVSVESTARRLFEEKGRRGELDIATPDFSVGVITFASGTVARFTTSIVAPENRQLLVVGDDALLSVEDCWNYGATIKKVRRFHREMDDAILRHLVKNHREEFGRLRHRRSPELLGLIRRAQAEIGESPVPLLRPPPSTGLWHNMDFARGIAECAGALQEGRSCRLPAALAVHVVEICIALQKHGGDGRVHRMETTCPPLDPAAWSL
jgi:predicted dehydrogenase